MHLTAITHVAVLKAGLPLCIATVASQGVDGGFGAKANIRPAGGRVRRGERRKEGETVTQEGKKRRVERKEDQQLVDRREQDDSRTGANYVLKGEMCPGRTSKS